MSKEILFKTLSHQKADRPAWVPFSGIHSGKLKNYTAKEVLLDGDKLFESLLEVNKLYQPDGQPVIFDLQIEAEILGCDLFWSEDTPPTVSSHPLASEATIPCECMLPTENDGRLPMILDVMRRMKADVGDTTALYGLICGPFTLASHLRGTNIFMDMYDRPDYVVDLVEFARKVCDRVARLYIEAGMDIIAYVDPLLSQISPENFEQFASTAYSELFDSLRNQGVYSSLFVCGDATKNIEGMCKTKPDSLSIDENIDIKQAKIITDQHNVVIGGNLQLTITMLHGNQLDNMQEVLSIIDNCSEGNLIIAPGCDMPYDTPIENVIAASQAVRNAEQARVALKGYEGSLDLSDIHIDMPDYNKLERPLLEVFTLDSQSCAACGYMMNMANVVKNNYGSEIDVIEYKFTEKENIKRCTILGVSNLPSMYLDGELCYSSVIPSTEELECKIDASISHYR